jgi:hypothetical protein
MRTALIFSLSLFSIACSSKFEAVEPVPLTTWNGATEPERPPEPVTVFESGFDTDGTNCEGWLVTGGRAFTTEAITASGLKSCRVCMQTSTSVTIERLIPVDKIGSYELIAQVRNESTRASASLSFTDDTNATDLGTFKKTLADGNDFTRVAVVGSPKNQPRMARIRFVAEKEGGYSCIDVDGVALMFVP